MPATWRAGGLRAPAVTFLITGTVIGLLAVTGGLREVPAAIGPELTATKPISLTNWRLTVQTAELGEQSPGVPSDPDVLRIRMTVLNTADESAFLPSGLLTARVATAVPVAESGSARALNGRYGEFDPGLPRVIDLVFGYPPYGSSFRGVPPAPSEVLLVVRDEAVNTSYIGRGDYEVGDVVGFVRLPCPDRRLPS